jgi:hypothetical protein
MTGSGVEGRSRSTALRTMRKKGLMREHSLLKSVPAGSPVALHTVPADDGVGTGTVPVVCAGSGTVTVTYTTCGVGVAKGG